MTFFPKRNNNQSHPERSKLMIMTLHACVCLPLHCPNTYRRGTSDSITSLHRTRETRANASPPYFTRSYPLSRTSNLCEVLFSLLGSEHQHNHSLSDDLRCPRGSFPITPHARQHPSSFTHHRKKPPDSNERKEARGAARHLFERMKIIILI